MITDKNIISKVKQNWILAAKRFNFKIITPYIINNKEFFAYLPGYGSKNGMIIGLITPPEFEIDKEIIELAKFNNFYYSFINIEDYIEFNELAFEDILKDWDIGNRASDSI